LRHLRVSGLGLLWAGLESAGAGEIAEEGAVSEAEGFADVGRGACGVAVVDDRALLEQVEEQVVFGWCEALPAVVAVGPRRILRRRRKWSWVSGRVVRAIAWSV
jgi:hypothetical protein